MTADPQTGEITNVIPGPGASAPVHEPKAMASLYAKMAKVMGDIERLPKSGHNSHFKYDYATESDIADAIRPLLAKYVVGP